MDESHYFSPNKVYFTLEASHNLQVPQLDLIFSSSIDLWIFKEDLVTRGDSFEAIL